MSQPIKTCVLGVGLAGLTFHVPFILALPELFVLSAVLERNPSTPGGKLQQRFGVTARIHKTLDAVLEDPEIELVIVGTPNEVGISSHDTTSLPSVNMPHRLITNSLSVVSSPENMSLLINRSRPPLNRPKNWESWPNRRSWCCTVSRIGDGTPTSWSYASY